MPRVLCPTSPALLGMAAACRSVCRAAGQRSLSMECASLCVRGGAGKLLGSPCRCMQKCTAGWHAAPGTALGLAHLPQLLDWELCRLLEMGSVQGCAMENTRIIEPLRLGKKTSQIPKSSPTMPTAHTSSASSPWFFGCSPTSPASCATGLCGCTTLARLCQALVSFLLQGQGRWLGMDREQSCCPWRH